MSFNEHYFNAAMDRLSKRRSDNRIITDLRRQEIYEKLPEYRREERSPREFHSWSRITEILSAAWRSS